MVSCYDCEHFGTACKGIVPPIEFRDTVNEYCAKFLVVPWRSEMYKPEGRTRM
jgi:hypothetical protein